MTKLSLFLSLSLSASLFFSLFLSLFLPLAYSLYPTHFIPLSLYFLSLSSVLSLLDDEKWAWKQAILGDEGGPGIIPVPRPITDPI